jgi:hypothetical protein
MKTNNLILIILVIIICTQALVQFKVSAESALIQEQKDKALDIIDSLDIYNDSLAIRVVELSRVSDSLQNSITIEKQKLKNEKNEHKKKLAELGKLSTAELPGYFSKRYNSK